jgi:peptidoglycan DL-endopeptidase CwlO
VVAFALAQVGDSYVFGATGMSSWDCSGLTMRAYASVGISLPHSSRAQYGSGRHISYGNLRPGDLVFFYSPIHHVGIYIGGGMIVHAANPGEGVTTAPLSSMPYDGAVRPY